MDSLTPMLQISGMTALFTEMVLLIGENSRHASESAELYGIAAGIAAFAIQIGIKLDNEVAKDHQQRPRNEF